MNDRLWTTVVVPTVGRPSLETLLRALDRQPGPRPAEVIVVDDRADGPLRAAGLPGSPRVVRCGGRGPAAARNLGWRLARTPWVSFLDDDVLPTSSWLELLWADLRDTPSGVAGSQGQVRVALPAHRRWTDWERATAGLAGAAWITADMTYRRTALATAGGFDERFRRAYREDADLALRVMNHGWALTRGQREVSHPVRPSSPWASVRVQAGNADDVLMRRLHGRDWHERAHAPAGRRRRHVAITLSGLAGLGLATAGHSKAAAALGTASLAGIAEFAAARIAPGTRDWREVARMVATSVAIPPVATWHTARAAVRYRRPPPWRGIPELVLFDRDGTLVYNVPYNGDPDRVEPLATAAEAVRALRARGVRVGVVTNQSGIASGRISWEQLNRVNRRVEELLGPFDVWQVCPHGPADGCECRKPAPGMIKSAGAQLGIDTSRCVVVGDIGADLAAAYAAGASAILVPAHLTRATEICLAERVAPDLIGAAEMMLAGT